MKHFTLNAWRQGSGQFALIGVDFDWLGSYLSFATQEKQSGWFAVTIGLLGFCACLTYWPGGRA